MADTARLEAEIASSQRNAAAARARAARLQAEAATVQRQIAKLEQELADMLRFKAKAESDTGELLGQLQARHRVLDQLGELQDVRMALQLLQQMSTGEIAQARGMMTRGAEEVTTEVNHGIAKIKREIERLRQELAYLNCQINEQRALAAQYDRRAQAAASDLRDAQANSD